MIRIYAFSVFFIGIHFQSQAQESGWYVDVMGKLAGHKFTAMSFNSMNQYLTSSNQDYYFLSENGVGPQFSHVVYYGLGGGYNLKPWLKAQLSVTYATGNEVGNRRRPVGGINTTGRGVSVSSGYSLSNSAFEVLPSLRFDLLAKSKDKDFGLLAGMGFGSVTRHTVFDAEGTVDSEPVKQELTTDRHIKYVRFNLGLEWRAYFSPHFGYFLRLNAGPALSARTSKIKIERLRVDGEAQPEEGQTIAPGEETLPEEKHEIIFADFEFGLSYRF